LVDVSTFTSCVTLPHLGSVPLYVYPRKKATLIYKNPKCLTETNKEWFR
jgi:hypothetical protein